MAYQRGTAYYRSRREGQRVVTDYLGSGEAGRLAAEADEEARAARRDSRARLEQQAQTDRELDVAIDDVGDLICALSDALLLCGGYHEHRGRWRKLRVNANPV